MRGLASLVIVCACSRSMGGMSDPLGPDASVDAASSVDGTVGPPTGAELSARIATCDTVIGGTFADSVGQPSDVSICGLPMAMFWKADMDIDCDGKTTAECNLMTDPSYDDQTAATDSTGMPLDAANLPYVVVPGVGSRFDYHTAGLSLGSVIAVIYGDRVEYGVFGDIGPQAIIGEASYKMAQLLGIDPDPSTGGIGDGVSYIAFVGAVVDPIEDHDRAVMIGIEHARMLLATP